MDEGNTMVVMDGIEIELPSPDEMPSFIKWLEKNNVTEPFHPAQHYDYVGAWRSGMSRGKGEDGHFLDTFKTPNHPTFSVESQYYRKGLPAGRWEGVKYIPIDEQGFDKGK